MRKVKKIRTRRGVTQLPDGRFMIRIDLPRGPNGERRRKKFTAKTQKEVIDKWQRHMTLLDRQIDPEGAIKTFRDFADWWLEHKSPETCSPNTRNNYRGMLTRHIYPVIGRMRLKDIRPRHVDDVVTNMLQNGLSLSSRKAARRVISAAFTAAIRREFIDVNPVKASTPPRLAPGEVQRERAVLTPDQLAHVLDKLTGEKYGLVLKLLATTGLRRGEACGLKWDDLYSRGDEFKLSVTKQLKEVTYRAPDGVKSTMLEETTTKTAKSKREVGIPAQIFHELQRSRPEGSRGDEYIFTGPNGNPIWPSNVTAAWSKIRVRLGYDGVRVHDLRHSFARNALHYGAPLEAVSDVLGHHSITITKDTYASTVVGASTKVTNVIEEMLRDTQTIHEFERQFAEPF